MQRDSEAATVADDPQGVDGYFGDPYPHYRALREGHGAVAEVDRDGLRTFVVTSFAGAREALRCPQLTVDPRRWPEGHHNQQLSKEMGANMLTRDGADHARLRAVASAAFTPRRVAEVRPRIEEVTRTLLDELAAAGDGTVDLFERFSYPFPILVIAELLGVPQTDTPRFRDWTASDVATAASDADTMSRRRADLAAMRDYFVALVEAKKAEVDHDGDVDAQNDLITALLRANSAGTISEQEILATLILIIIAGHETTANLITSGMRWLFDHPDQLAALVEQPDLVPGAVEELLRFEGPLLVTPNRIALEDVEIAGCPVPAASIVSIVLGAANRDEAQFDEPDRLDVGRPRRSHLAFGFGDHVCLGAPLARMEAQIALTGLLARYPGIRPAVPSAELTWRPTTFIRGLNGLPVLLR